MVTRKKKKTGSVFDQSVKKSGDGLKNTAPSVEPTHWGRKKAASSHTTRATAVTGKYYIKMLFHRGGQKENIRKKLEVGRQLRGGRQTWTRDRLGKKKGLVETERPQLRGDGRRRSVKGGGSGTGRKCQKSGKKDEKKEGGPTTAQKIDGKEKR